MGLPPWEGSTSQRYILVTGSNSGLGYAICERLIDEFLSSAIRDPKSHLVLLASTRSLSKCADTIKRLRVHTKKYCQASTSLKARATSKDSPYSWKTEAARIHYLSATVDLCDLRSVYRLAEVLRGDNDTGLSSPPTEEGGKGLEGVQIPRLDVVYLNAGIGGWSGIPYAKAIWNMFPDLKDSFTYWSWFTFPEKGALVRPQSSYVRKDGKQQVVGAGEKSNGNANGSANGSVNGNGHAKKDDEEEPPLGEIFCANVFGHYLLTHELMPLLSVHRGRVDGDRGRVVFISTLKPTAQDLPMNDLQGLTSKNPYYGSKRLTDLLGLTAKLPAVRSINSDFWHLKNYTLPPYKYSPTLSSTSTTSSSKPNTICHTTHTEDATTSETETESKPELYVAQPGIVNTSISGMNPLMSLFMVLGFYFARWLGGVWFPISAYPGAVAPVFVGLSEQSKLDELETPPLTSISRSSTGSVSASGSDGEGGSNGESRTSGDFHGWDERDPVQAKVKWGSGTDIWGRERVLKTEVEGWGWSGRVGEVIEPRGRRKGARDLGKEEREDFEGDGRYAWTWMEGVRRAWEGRLGVGDAVR